MVRPIDNFCCMQPTMPPMPIKTEPYKKPPARVIVPIAPAQVQVAVQTATQVETTSVSVIETPTKPTDDKVNQVAVPILSDAELEKAYDREIELNQKKIEEEEGRFRLWGKVDVTKEKTLIAQLAIKLADLLKKVFDGLFTVTKTRPMTVSEELELAKVAKRLQNAYKLSGNAAKEQEAARQVAEAKLRAAVKQKKIETLESLKGRIKQLEEWAKTPRYDGIRNFLFMWTTDSAKLEAAKLRVHVAIESMRDVVAYPKLLKPALEEVIKAKTALLSLLKPDTVEHLATARELREHSAELEKLSRNNQKNRGFSMGDSSKFSSVSGAGRATIS